MLTQSCVLASWAHDSLCMPEGTPYPPTGGGWARLIAQALSINLGSLSSAGATGLGYTVTRDNPEL